MKHSDGIFLAGKNINDITEILFGMSDWKWLLYPIVLFYVMPFFFFSFFPKNLFTGIDEVNLTLQIPRNL